MFRRLHCLFIPESIAYEWEISEQMELMSLILFGTSMAPNGIDIWLSGGLAMRKTYSVAGGISARIKTIQSTLYVIRYAC